MVKKKEETLNFQKAMYENIGKRCRKQREAKSITQKKLQEKLDNRISERLISAIENGNADKERNPYLFPKEMVKPFCDALGSKPEILIWGTQEERENFVKIILLAVLMNGVKYGGKIVNPFFYSDDYIELFQWADKQSVDNEDLRAYLSGVCLIIQNGENINKDTVLNRPHCFYQQADPNGIRYKWVDFDSSINMPEILSNQERADNAEKISVDELHSKVQNYFKKKYGFFFDSDNFSTYEKIKTNYIADYDKLSNLLLAQILNEPIFAQSFMERLAVRIWNQTNFRQSYSEDTDLNIDAFIMGKGQYGNIALDYKGINYPKFINAFNKFWEKKKETYMKFFDLNVFQKYHENIWLKAFNDQFFHNLLCSPEFIELNQQSTNLDVYYDKDAVIAQQFIRSIIQESLAKIRITSRSDESEKEDDMKFYQYLCKMVTETQQYIDDTYIDIPKDTQMNTADREKP